MRIGPNYSQWVERTEYDEVLLRLPLELEHEWDGMKTVVWTDNGDGTYTLRPSQSI